MTMSLQNDLELLSLRENYMKNASNPNMLSCVNTNSSVKSEDLQDDEHDSTLQWTLRHWFGGKSSSSNTNHKINNGAPSIRRTSCQPSKPNDKLNRLVSFYL
ncbi:unnamed protein product [Absidia cylindrospora]